MALQKYSASRCLYVEMRSYSRSLSRRTPASSEPFLLCHKRDCIFYSTVRTGRTRRMPYNALSSTSPSPISRGDDPPGQPRACQPSILPPGPSLSAPRRTQDPSPHKSRDPSGRILRREILSSPTFMHHNICSGSPAVCSTRQTSMQKACYVPTSTVRAFCESAPGLPRAFELFPSQWSLTRIIIIESFVVGSPLG